MTRIAVAAVSARLMAEAAAADGYEAVALDLFGDADTREAAAEWQPIGRPERLQIDARMFRTALRALAERGDCAGWVAGAGFEGRPDLLEEGHALLPSIGAGSTAVRLARDARHFFGLLSAHGIAHPPFSLKPPAEGAGWLLKDAHGTGGWHVRRLAGRPEEPPDVHHYFQREQPGLPMSATFVADGRHARVLGFNEMTVRRIGERPFVFCGVIGPVSVPAAVARELERAANVVAARLPLHGLASLDFLLDGDGPAEVIELNPRPPASMALYGPGMMRAHVDACLRRVLPAPRPPSAQVAGAEIVYARRPIVIDARAAERLARWPRCHDRPMAGVRFDIGDPVCTLSAVGNGVAQVRAKLKDERERLLEQLETNT